MQYFKPVAGIIVLIFVLAVLFYLFVDQMNNRSAQQQEDHRITQQEEQRRAYSKCIDDAEFHRDTTTRLGNEMVEIVKDTPDYNEAMNRCMRINYTVRPNGGVSDEVKDSLYLRAQSNCRQQIEQEIKAESYHSPYDDATVAAVYEESVANCKVKYGQ